MTPPPRRPRSTIQVWDKDLIGSDDLIGELTLPLSTIAYVRQPLSRARTEALYAWHPLFDKTKVECGQVKLGLSFESLQEEEQAAGGGEALEAGGGEMEHRLTASMSELDAAVAEAGGDELKGEEGQAEREVDADLMAAIEEEADAELRQLSQAVSAALGGAEEDGEDGGTVALFRRMYQGAPGVAAGAWKHIVCHGVMVSARVSLCSQKSSCRTNHRWLC